MGEYPKAGVLNNENSTTFSWTQILKTILIKFYVRSKETEEEAVKFDKITARIKNFVMD